MKREVLFRGLSTQTNEWVYGVPIFPKDQQDIAYILNEECEVVVHRKTVGQFTGRKDKDANRIFEGDIVGGYPHGTVVVRWDNRYCCFESVGENTIESDDHFEVTETSSLFANDLEDCINEWLVLGNIHTTPELLSTTWKSESL